MHIVEGLLLRTGKSFFGEGAGPTAEIPTPLPFREMHSPFVCILFPPVVPLDKQDCLSSNYYVIPGYYFFFCPPTFFSIFSCKFTAHFLFFGLVITFESSSFFCPT
eukprot:TRINITY_DN1243_c0_g1_i1.p1 TRINITY_DN1243_c0_g1~~TRINITY_DN1243_c0_g1_i1.p1  ORF type:complete len:106 (-),score=7.54 TRINITY_DN1243_c0_g1_i1:868-1185(-)